MKAILKKLISKITHQSPLYNMLLQSTARQEQNLTLTGNSIIKNFDYSKEIKNFKEVEFRVFSQFGDDGIIQYLIHKIDVPVKSFIEFGVENYKESNTRFLLINDNWSGLVIDGSKSNIDFIKKDSITWRNNLTAKEAFIDAENINDLISSAGFAGEIGILSIDIDGNDYWVWNAITVVDPVIVIVEYNSVFGNNRAISVPYKKDFQRTKAHYSNLYFGASLSALCHLAEKKGYYFVGSDSHGANAYFVRKDKINKLKPITADEGYVVSKFTQSRNINGDFNHIHFTKQLDIMKGLQVVNVVTNKSEAL